MPGPEAGNPIAGPRKTVMGGAPESYQPPALSQRPRVDHAGDANDALSAQAPVPAVDGAFGEVERDRYRGERRPRSDLQGTNDAHIIGLHCDGIRH